ncbi:MAG: hypothetical protein KDC34_02420 [Saprospiraceae bacterium]|nr:hypothetical protein [Saprospiraceae bacterium]
MRTLLTILGLIFSIALFSCQGEKNDDLAQLEALEAAIESGEATDEQVEELSAKYLEYMENHPDDHDSNSKHLQTMAQFQYGKNRYTGALSYLKQALRDHYVPQRAAAQVRFMATIYKDKLNNPVLGNCAYWAFVQAFPDNMDKQLIQDSLLRGVPGIPAQLDTLSRQLYDEANARIDYTRANQFIDVSEIYALAMPNDPKSADMLAEAGKVAGYVNAHGRALELYNWIHTHYPTHPKAGQALFMMGFIYDNEPEFQDKEKAKSYYEAFIASYPEDEFADDATFLLQNLNKSNEEIINGFEGEKKE